MDIKAEAKYLRISPRKLRLVAETVKKMPLEMATANLTLMNKKGASLLLKLLKSAISNAKNNLNLREEDLKIKSITVDKGIVFKRWQPVSRGMAHAYKKQTSHAKIILEEIAKKTAKGKKITKRRKNGAKS